MRPICFIFSLLVIAGCAGQKPGALAQNTTSPTALSTQKPGAPELKWEVLGSFPHASDAFTEGLLIHDGKLYESTGLEGQSSLRRVDLQSGAVEKKVNLPKELFGEGLALAGNKFYQLTWQNKLGMVYDENFKPLAKFSFQNEGWGLTYDGKSLIQSDGTDTLTWRDPKDFSAQKEVKVTWDGEPQKNINELEWINGKIWANIWQQDDIVIIDPASGKVESSLDLSTIISDAERGGNENVLNGIAYDEKNQRIFITGKNWPKLYWIRVQD
ncbi:hypothetical protein IAD21_01569 [Abditibacteriota bacterium]|nr:hypothetical protein IAD21_01569 [Abditibacteriota bacterium]